MKRIDQIFDAYSQNNIFEDKKILQVNYKPENIPHRDKQIDQLAGILAPVLRGERSSNLFIYGQTGCISGETLVFSEKGYIPIKNLKNKNLKILSFNLDKKRYEWEKPIFLEYVNNDMLLKITLDNGQEIIVTKDHPLLKSNFEWSKADQLVEDEEILFSYNMPNISENKLTKRLARVLGFMIGGGSLNGKKKLVNDSKSCGYNSDRQGLKFFASDEFLLDLVKEDLQKLYNDKVVQVSPDSKCPHLKMISQQACQNLNSYEIPFGFKSGNVIVPKVVFNSNLECQSEFVKGLFTADGYVDKNTYQIELFSKSKNLLQGVNLILNNFGISSKVKKKPTKSNDKIFNIYGLHINGQENLHKFYYKIGFLGEKQRRMKNLLQKYKNKMPIYDENYLKVKIEKIEEVYDPTVYDLTMPKNHNFIANGFISHNTGKTLSTHYVRNEIEERIKNKNLPLKIEYLNCKLRKVADTEYRILAELIRKFGGSVPSTGLPTDKVYSKFIEKIEEEEKLIIIILDEIDQIVKKISDGFLYNLTRLNSELSKTQLTIIGISNELNFLDSLDPRVRSSLSEEEIVFPPYNAIQLQDILKKRADKSFKDNVLEEGVISKCAAYAAREHGDARRALDLLRVAAELAEREGNKKVKLEHVDQSNEKIDKDKILEVVESAPKQFRIVLLSIIKLSEEGSGKFFTGDVYNRYYSLSRKTNTDALTQRRVSDIVAEIDMLGLVNARVISKGRHGRTREIKLSIPKKVENKVKKILTESLDL